jgi:hypothetical protein
VIIVLFWHYPFLSGKEWLRRIGADGQVLSTFDTVCSSSDIYIRWFPFFFFSSFSFHHKTPSQTPLPFPFFLRFFNKKLSPYPTLSLIPLHLKLLPLSRSLRPLFTIHNEVHSLRRCCSRPRCLPGYRHRPQARQGVHSLLCRRAYVQWPLFPIGNSLHWKPPDPLS